MNDSNELAVRTQLDPPLIRLQELETKIQVTDQASYIVAGNFLVEANAYLKDVNAKLDVGINSAKAHLDTLKNQKAGYVNPVKLLIDIVKGKAERWRADEKARADAEARRIADELARKQREQAEQDRREAERIALEARKEKVAEIRQLLKDGHIGKREAAKRLKEAGAEEEATKATAAAVAEEEKNKPAPTVNVKASVPVVAGMRNVTNYFTEVTDSEALISDLILASLNRDQPRALFLRQFIQLNEQVIGKFARDTKDPEKVMKLLPGVRAWSKG